MVALEFWYEEKLKRLKDRCDKLFIVKLYFNLPRVTQAMSDRKFFYAPHCLQWKSLSSSDIDNWEQSFFFGFVMKYFLFYVVGKIFLVPRMIFVDPMGWYYGVTFPANSVAISHFADNIFTTGKYNLILELWKTWECVVKSRQELYLKCEWV